MSWNRVAEEIATLILIDKCDAPDIGESNDTAMQKVLDYIKKLREDLKKFEESTGG